MTSKRMRDLVAVFTLGVASVLVAQEQTTPSTKTVQAADHPVQPGFYRIVADAACSIYNAQPVAVAGPNTLRAEPGNKIYLRFFIGWAAGQKISSARLCLTTAYWYPEEKSFDVYQLRDGIPADARMGWDEKILCAGNAPANLKDSEGFDPQMGQKLGLWEVEKIGKEKGVPCIFESQELIKALTNDTNGYLTLMIANHAGINNSGFQNRLVLDEGHPFLEITTDGKGGVDMRQPVFVVASGARQTISGYGTGTGPDHAVKAPGEWHGQYGANLGSLSDRPERLQEYFRLVYTDTGANTLRLWWIRCETFDKEIARFENGYVKTGIIKAAKGAGITRFFLCSNPPERMWAPTPTPDSYGIQPLSDSGVKDYPENLADIATLLKKKHGLELYMITIANEELRITIKQWPLVVRNLRKALDARGLRNVKIGGVDWPSNDNYAWDRLKAIQDDPEAWKAFNVATTHSYAMSVTEDFFRQFIQGQTDKEFWVTETSASGPTQTSVGKNLLGHLMNDLNHGVATWIFHESGLAVSGDHMCQLAGYDPKGPDGNWLSIPPKYYYFKQIATTFPVGTKMRRIWGSTLGDVWYPGWGTAKALATAGQRKDGSWGLAVLNTAEPDEADKNRTYTLAVEELARVPSLPANVFRIAEGESKEDKPTGEPKQVPIKRTQEKMEIKYGTITLILGPNELVTLETGSGRPPGRN